MSMTDPIADLLSRIRTAHLAKHDRLDVPASKLKNEICGLLKEQGYINDYELVEDDPVKSQIRIFLKYTPEGNPMIRHLQRVSKPGRRVYRGAEDLRPVLNGLGVYRFEDIARWTVKDIERISGHLDDFPERIRRDNWVQGARREHVRKYGEDL